MRLNFISYHRNNNLFILYTAQRRLSNGWSPWSEWECTATCGGGAGRKTRTCLDPGPNKCPGKQISE